MSGAWRAYGTGTYGGSGGIPPGPPTPPPLPPARTPYDRLLRLRATIHHRSDTVDAHGDVATSETLTEAPCHAYQRYRIEEADGRILGIDEIVVHLPIGTPVETGDRIDIVWPTRRTILAEVIGPPALRVRATTGRPHHIEVRTREIA